VKCLYNFSKFQNFITSIDDYTTSPYQFTLISSSVFVQMDRQTYIFHLHSWHTDNKRQIKEEMDIK